MNSDKKKPISAKEAELKIQKYCAYQERSHFEVRNTLYRYGLYSNEVNEIMERLVSHDFLNEQRFANAYAGGKFRIKQWGRRKIEQHLKNLRLSARCIEEALSVIEEDEYYKTLRRVLVKKVEVEKWATEAEQQKAVRYAIGKGYEPELVWKMVKEILKKRPGKLRA